MSLHFQVSSKDYLALKKFLQVLQELEVSPIVLKHFSKQKKRKFITILKSPHVNKTAQEQFEFRYYRQEFMVNSSKPLTFLLILKKFKNTSFPGLKLEVKGSFNLNEKNQNLIKLFNPDGFVLNLYNSETDKALYFQKKYIQLFDGYGELYLKGLCRLKIRPQVFLT